MLGRQSKPISPRTFLFTGTSLVEIISNASDKSIFLILGNISSNSSK